MAALCAFLTVPLTPVNADQKDREALGKAALRAYSANVHSFDFYSCRFRYTTAQARSVSDALQGKFLNAVSFDNRLLVDGEKDLYEGLTPARLPDPKKAIPVKGRPGLSIVPSDGINSDRYLANGKEQMNYVPQMQSLGLGRQAGPGGPRGVPYSPLGFSLIGHRGREGPDFLAAHPALVDMTSEGLEEVEGQAVITLTFTEKPPGELVTRFSFDPARGFLPSRISLYRGKLLRTQVFLTHARECSRQRWFPERTVTVRPPSREGELYSVGELQLLELDADHRPGESEFAFTIPAGTQVNSWAQDGKFFHLKQDEKVHVNDLPGLFALLDRSRTQPLLDTAVPHSSPYRWPYWWGGAIGLLVVLGGISYSLRRSFRRPVA